MPEAVALPGVPTVDELKAYELRLSRLLVAFLGTGMVFLFGPGGFLGVWNLVRISRAEAPGAIPPEWLQAHGHAMIYGWVGSFILGIGFHSLARVRSARVPMRRAWTCWGLWTVGLALRWAAGISAWHWRVLLPLAGALELVAFGMFQAIAFGAHRKAPHAPAPAASTGAPARKPGMPGWVLLVLTGAAGFGLTLLLNLAADICHAGWTATRAYTPGFDTRMVTLMGWAFLTPFVLGFSVRWFPIFAGFRPAPNGLARRVVTLVAVGVVATLVGWFLLAAAAWLAVALLAVASLGVLRPAVQPAKIQGIHPGFPAFLRLAYGWLLVSALLGLWAALAPATAGLLGASRHALTVGFVAGMILTIGSRILPAFTGMRLLYSPRLMGVSLVLLNLGCALRVSSEVLAYSWTLPAAWPWLPFSAALEATAIALFAYNLIRTLLRPPAHLARATA